MTKNYYKHEYTEADWRNLVDRAIELGCNMEYSKYGNILTIDSTDLETRILAHTWRGEQDRYIWAERIHELIELGRIHK